MIQATEKNRLIALLEAPIQALGYELVDLDWRSGRRGLMRIFIDRADGVTLEDCETVSRQIGALLDVEDPVPGSYVLEVSSPGLDRRLRKAEHFERVMGQEIKIQLQRAQDGRRRFRGRLRGLEDGIVSIDVDGTEWRLPLADIDIATLVPTF